MSDGPVERETLRRIIMAVVAAEANRARGGTDQAAIEDLNDWADDRAFSVGATALDSLEMVHAGAALQEMFGLASGEQAVPRRSPGKVGDWLDDIGATLGNENAYITVMTSGSTGQPKPCRHAVRDLVAEAAYFAAMLPEVRRVVALVPAHHIYGMIWTAFLPARLGAPVIAASTLRLPELCAGDLLVGVPEQWRALSRSRRSWPRSVFGVSAAAPLERQVADELRAAGLDRLYDVYGSSETGGIGVRASSDPGYTLLPRWRFALATGMQAAIVSDRDGSRTALPDQIEIAEDGRFVVIGRRDGAVQVGGMNVWPEYVADLLRRCPGVAEVNVRLGDEHRLKAFVVPSQPHDEGELLKRLRRHALLRLLPEQRPASYVFGGVLPRTQLGKARDW